MKRLFAAAAGLVLSACLSLAPAFAAYPDRPITLIVPWGAGGGTDAVARILASLLERDLGQPVAVVNRTGGQGVVGHQAIADAAADGYTIGLLTVEIAMMHWQGLTKLDPGSYTPLALVNEDPAGLQVRADAPYKTARDVIDDVQKNPGKYKASGTGQGGIWHLALAGMLSSLKVQPASVPWVPSNGAAPGLQDLVAGGVQIVTCSLPEARSLIDAGRVKSLAIMSKERSRLMPDVPTLKEATGSDWVIGAWRGIAGPKGLPKEVADKLIPALKKAYESKDYQDFLTNRGFGGRWAEGAAFGTFMAESDASLGAVMKEVGLAK
ncbi:tripartite tricarboxylate transporter substrate binding protein [Aquabacter sp. CN5-332]|uniref:tripartite tricarboxylate transporter substrate binding protein n=1 Tax=Aquabacter sp. CN5-332 TaxID=3156608 RepID=UPI0032B5F2DA